MTNERKKEKKARDLIHKALNEFNPGLLTLPEFTDERISDDKFHEELTKDGIDAGISAFRLINNMSGVSGVDVDLYELLQQYLLDMNVRKQINSIIK